MRRTACLLLALVMLLSQSACSDEKGTPAETAETNAGLQETNTAEALPSTNVETVCEEVPEANDPLADFKAVGSIVTFGAYEQDGDPTNGAEPVEWIVLDVQDGKSLLISKYGLDARPYHEDGKTDVTWETCDLRAWLNNEFLNTAFSIEEQDRIPTAIVPAERNPKFDTDPGKDTQDKVFLLSIQDANQYFASDADRQCKPTETVAQKCAPDEESGCCSWWLRSPSGKSSNAQIVDRSGCSDFGTFAFNNTVAVRPALWFYLDGSAQPAAETAENDRPEIIEGDFSQIGGIVTFGAYEQDGDPASGTEPIEWIVLDVQDGKSLLISKFALDGKQYHEDGQADVAWETCSLRTWLNDGFLKAAFTEEQQEHILSVTVPAEQNPDYDTAPGKDTEDMVFLLSIQEATLYFGSDAERQCAPTWLAEINGCYANGIYDFNCSWWLRSPGSMAHSAAYVRSDGSVYTSGDGIAVEYTGVRPAIWVNPE